jgi:hypothetical protein
MKSNMRMTARASRKTDKVQLSLIPPVSYSLTPKPANITSTTEGGRVDNGGGRRIMEEGDGVGN